MDALDRTIFGSCPAIAFHWKILADSMIGSTRTVRVTYQPRAAQSQQSRRMVSFGIPLEIATLMAPHQGPEMGRAIHCCTARRGNPRWPKPAARWKPLPLGQACYCWRPRIHISDPKKRATW